MSTQPKTVDNLGVDLSAQYARGQKNIDPKLLRESRSVPIHTQVTTTEPSFQSHVEELLAFNKKNISFAKFNAPKGFHSHQMAIFTYQIVPSMGSFEKQEVNRDKLDAMKEEERKKEQQEDDDNEERKRELASEELQEIAIVTKMLKKMGLLDKYLSMINSRREQYHKG